MSAPKLSELRLREYQFPDGTKTVSGKAARFAFLSQCDGEQYVRADICDPMRDPRVLALVEAARPFADYASSDGFGKDHRGADLPGDDGVGWVYLKIKDFREICAALRDLEQGEG